MVKRCMETNKLFGICLPRQIQDGSITPFTDYGTIVEIVRCEVFGAGDLADTEDGPLPRYIIETLGKNRFKVESSGQETAGYYYANVNRVDDIDNDDADVQSYIGQEEKLVKIPMFDTMGNIPLVVSIVKAVGSIQGALVNSRSDPVSSPWSPVTLTILTGKVRGFVDDLVKGLHPDARMAIESQFGAPPLDMSDLSYWVAQVLPLGCEVKYLLLRVDSLKNRLKIIWKWIQNARGELN